LWDSLQIESESPAGCATATWPPHPRVRSLLAYFFWRRAAVAAVAAGQSAEDSVAIADKVLAAYVSKFNPKEDK